MKRNSEPMPLNSPEMSGQVMDTHDDAMPERTAPSRSWSWERAGLRRLLAILGNPPIRFRLWDGHTEESHGVVPIATVEFTSRASLLRLLLQQTIAFGDEYARGRIRVDGDLVGALTAIVAATHIKAKSTGYKWLTAIVRRPPRFNSVPSSRRHIHHHYDIGNDFYRLWLDREMQYTCAYFPKFDLSIEQAQQEKMHHVCRKLQLKPGDRVVEAGCGWGSLARFMASHYGANVTAYNISKEQIKFATECAAREGLSDQVTYVEDDYRNIDGEFDVFVSVGMLEHVGVRNYQNLGEVIVKCLRPGGRGLIHAIGRNKRRTLNAWIERRIFPGAYPPTLRQMMNIFEPVDLAVLDVENLRMHYAKTTEYWLQRFDRAESDVAEMFDEQFVRAWRLYLSGSIAAFRGGSLQLFQVVFAHGADNNVPWTRQHIYS